MPKHLLSFVFCHLEYFLYSLSSISVISLSCLFNCHVNLWSHWVVWPLGLNAVCCQSGLHLQQSVHFSRSVTSNSLTPWTAARQATLSITNSWNLLKLMSIELVMPSNHLILCHPLLLLPSIFPSIRVFSNKSVLCTKWPKYWSFSISPSNEHSGLISFRIDWFDLLAVQGTLKSLLQHHVSKASVFRCKAFFCLLG